MRKLAYRLAPAWGERRLTAGEERTRLAAYFGDGLWNVDVVELRDDVLRIAGWALLAPHSDRLWLHVNGKPCSSFHPGLLRADIASLYTHLPEAHVSGFEAEHQVSETPPEWAMEWRARSGEQLGLPLAYAPVESEPLPFPDAARMKRVAGTDDVAAFQLSGYTHFRRLEEALRRVSGAGFAHGMRVLDWGCGCGRIARHFQRRPGVDLVGVDVDADNARWCAAHLGRGAFESIPLQPPTALADRSFDVIFGLSVFTHLTEPTQLRWLHELRRLLRPDGCALVSVHARAAIAQHASWPLWLLTLWEQRGFVDGQSFDLAGHLPPDYYRTTYHHPDYIKREWTKVFSRVELLEGYVGNQALCILRP